MLLGPAAGVDLGANSLQFLFEKSEVLLGFVFPGNANVAQLKVVAFAENVFDCFSVDNLATKICVQPGDSCQVESLLIFVFKQSLEGSL